MREQAAADAAAPAPSTLAAIGLTPRQTDVLGLLLQGKPNKLIARELNVSVETVKGGFENVEGDEEKQQPQRQGPQTLAGKHQAKLDNDPSSGNSTHST